MSCKYCINHLQKSKILYLLIDQLQTRASYYNRNYTYDLGALIYELTKI